MIEAKQSELTVVGEYRQSGRKVEMRVDAAVALENLMAEARHAGIGVIPISGFRAVDYQAKLFDNAVKKHGSAEAASRWVARPGESEHHTGLAVDLGDEKDGRYDAEPGFESTQAFEWLMGSALRFGFEMSFPKGNSRGVNYEPWHWRFIGTVEAKQVFK